MTRLRHLPPRYNAEDAWRFFRRPRWGNLFGLLTRAGEAPSLTPGVLPRLERIWMPYYLIDFRVNSHKGPGIISVSLEAWSGSFALFERHDALVEGEVKEEHFPPEWTEENAIAQARHDLLQNIMRRRGQQGKPVIEAAEGIGLFYYPFWVCYFMRYGRYVDIRLMDAYTGESGGNRNKQGVLNAMVAQKRAQTPPATPGGKRDSADDPEMMGG